MSKRVADKYLTDQNWEEEDEPQEAGVFQKADNQVLKTRVMKKAVRRTVDTSSSGAGVFSGFSGLTSTSTTGQATSNGFKGFNMPSSTGGKPGLFSFGRGNITTEKPKEVGNVTSSISSSDKPATTETDKDSGRPKPMFTNPVTSQASDTNSQSSSEDKKESEYNRHLSALNKSVSRWIADHVEKNALCDLTPVFKDYEKHLSSIDEKYGENSQSECDSSQNSDKTNTNAQKTKAPVPEPTPAPAPKTTPTPTPPPTTATKIEFPKKASAPTKPVFGLSTSTGTTFKGFGGFQNTSKPFSSGAPTGFTGFQFGSKMVSTPSSSQSSSQPDSQTSNEEEYVPPKPDVDIVKEEGAVYTKKCKLFYMKDGVYADKGVGHLHLKPVPSTNKTQLIVRADTTLGNLLLNIVLNPAMPINKQGKNNVAISCIPNPPIDESEENKVTPMLIRVKTSEDADELEKLLNEKKKSE